MGSVRKESLFKAKSRITKDEYKPTRLIVDPKDYENLPAYDGIIVDEDEAQDEDEAKGMQRVLQITIKNK